LRLGIERKMQKSYRGYRDFGYLDEDEYQRFMNRYEEVNKMLYGNGGRSYEAALFHF